MEMDWNKIGAIGSLGSFILGLILFALQIWPVPQFKARKAKAPASGTAPRANKLVAAFLVLSFLLASLAIYGAWYTDRRRWQSTKQETIYGKTYSNETVEMDGKKFDHCKFTNVTFLYHGLAPFDFVAANFGGSTRVVTDNDAVKGFLIMSESLSKYPGLQVQGISEMDEHGNIMPIVPKITKTESEKEPPKKAPSQKK